MHVARKRGNEANKLVTEGPGRPCKRGVPVMFRLGVILSTEIEKFT
jgi:hypothetical protein